MWGFRFGLAMVFFGKSFKRFFLRSVRAWQTQYVYILWSWYRRRIFQLC